MKCLKYLSLALVIAVAGSGQTNSAITREGSYWVQTTRGSIALGGARQLKVTTRGAVKLEGVDAEQISYSLTKRAKTPGEAEAARLLSGVILSTDSRGDWVSLTAASPADSRTITELTVNAPHKLASAVLRTQQGNVEALGLRGNLEIASGAGAIHADRIRGRLSAETGGGEIRLGRVDGPVRCFSGGGGIRVEFAGGESSLETGGGEIFVKEAAGPLHTFTGGGNIHIDRAASSVSARTANGLIEVREAGGEVTAETAGGSIQIWAARSVRCESGAGAIRLRGVSGALHATTAAGSILAGLLAGVDLKDSFLNTSFGDVTVLIPSKLAVTVKAHNVPAGKAAEIVSEFPQIQVRSAAMPVYGPVLAEGALNGGGPLLKIFATGGTIYLRRRE